MRVKQSEVKEYRLKQWESQNRICPLCRTEIEEEEAALDHDHDTGIIREVLHRSCNQTEGRIKSWINRSRFQGDHTEFLQNIIEYLNVDRSMNDEHPGHKIKMIRQFRALNKPIQIDKLLSLGVVVEGKHTKKSLTKLYKKSLT